MLISVFFSFLYIICWKIFIEPLLCSKLWKHKNEKSPQRAFTLVKKNRFLNNQMQCSFTIDIHLYGRLEKKMVISILKIRKAFILEVKPDESYKRSVIQSEKEIKQTSPFTIVPKIIKYWGIILNKKGKNLQIENYKVVLKKLKKSQIL